MQGIEYKFEELEPVDYPGVMVEGWAEIEVDEDKEWYVERIFVGSKDCHRELLHTDRLFHAINITLNSKDWEGYVWSALKKYNEE